MECAPNNDLAPKVVETILSLRLLIARAANRDSLAWWDDESLAPHASFLLGRIFPMAPAGAARSLALRAALARHEAACATYDKAVHLYRLDTDGRDRLVTRFTSSLPIPVPERTITTMDVLEQLLLAATGEPMSYTIVTQSATHGLQIRIPPAPAGTSPLLHRAQTFAWAYLAGEPGRPVFPFAVRETTKELSF